MLYRGKAHSGTCAIAVASLVCGLHAASQPLVAQPLPLPAEQKDTAPRASFEERFSSALRARPVFTYPELQNLLASMPPSTPSAEALVADVEARPGSDMPEGFPTEPHSAQNTASVTGEQPNAAVGTSAPYQEAQLPEFPPPPQPAEVVLPSAEELAAANAPPSPTDTPSVSTSEATRQAEASKLAASQTKPNLKKRPVQRAAQARRPATAQSDPAATGAIPNCRTGAACVSQQQSFAIFLGFMIGGLLGGPGGAIAGGAVGAVLTASNGPGVEAHSAQRP